MFNLYSITTNQEARALKLYRFTRTIPAWCTTIATGCVDPAVTGPSEPSSF